MAIKKKVGRPAGGGFRRKLAAVYFTDDEKQTILAASTIKQENFSDYVREAALTKSKKVLDEAALCELEGK